MRVQQHVRLCAGMRERRQCKVIGHKYNLNRLKHFRINKTSPPREYVAYICINCYWVVDSAYVLSAHIYLYSMNELSCELENWKYLQQTRKVSRRHFAW